MLGMSRSAVPHPRGIEDRPEGSLSVASSDARQGGVLMTIPKIGDLVWHIHHDTLCEPLTQPFETRVSYILSQKLAIEVPTRLRLMKPVRGKLPEWEKARAELLKAGAAWEKAYVEWDKAGAKLDKAGAEFNKAHAEWGKARAEMLKALRHPSVLALHAKECPDCPWDGKTIFPPAEQEGTP